MKDCGIITFLGREVLINQLLNMDCIFVLGNAFFMRLRGNMLNKKKKYVEIIIVMIFADVAILIFWTRFRLELNQEKFYHFWFTIKLLLAKSIMFSFVECIIFFIFFLKSTTGYLFILENKGCCIVLAISVEDRIKRMLIEGRWAEQHIHFTGKIGRIIHCLQW